MPLSRGLLGRQFSPVAAPAASITLHSWPHGAAQAAGAAFTTRRETKGDATRFYLQGYQKISGLKRKEFSNSSRVPFSFTFPVLVAATAPRVEPPKLQRSEAPSSVAGNTRGSTSWRWPADRCRPSPPAPPRVVPLTSISSPIHPRRRILPCPSDPECLSLPDRWMSRSLRPPRIQPRRSLGVAIGGRGSPRGGRPWRSVVLVQLASRQLLEEFDRFRTKLFIALRSASTMGAEA